MKTPVWYDDEHDQLRDMEGTTLYIQDLHYEVCRRINTHDALVAALEWYVENDPTNDSEPVNDPWLKGKIAAESALTAARGE